jgi:hypothetical protein
VIRRAAPLIAWRPESTCTAAPPWYTIAMLAALLAMAAGSHRANAQSAPMSGLQQRLPGSVTLGPRLLEYRIECVNPGSCRVQCFQHGVKVIDRGHIDKNDQLRMFASTSVRDEIIPRWIEIRSADGKDAQTLLLSSATTCDLKSLVISPNEHP